MIRDWVKRCTKVISCKFPWKEGVGFNVKINGTMTADCGIQAKKEALKEKNSLTKEIYYYYYCCCYYYYYYYY